MLFLRLPITLRLGKLYLTTMGCISISYNLKIKWEINGYPNYAFTERKQLYNLKSGRRIKKIVIGYSKGYCLNGRFITLNKLRPMLKKPERIDIPF